MNEMRKLFSERKSEMIKDLEVCDFMELKNTQSVAEYAAEIFENLKKEEAYFMPDPDYLRKKQTEIRESSRAVLIEWIMEGHMKFRLMADTLFLTVSIIDRYLEKKELKKSQLQLLGLAALLISTKYEEIYPPEVSELIEVSDHKFRKKEILKMETELLGVLGFDFTVPTPYRFLQRFAKVADAS